MTTLPPRVPSHTRPLLRLPETWLRSLLAGLEAAFLGWLLVVVPAVAAYVATAAAPLLGEATWVDAAAAGTGVWLLGHGGRIDMGESDVISLVPLGISLMSAALLYGTARRARLRRTATAAFALAGYVLGVLALSAVVRGPAGRDGVLLGALLIGVCALTLALVRARALPPSWWVRLHGLTPGYVAAGLRAGGLALAALLTLATAATGYALVRGVVTIADLHATLEAGQLGAVVLVLLQLAFLPTLIVWALGWLSGAGFAVGAGTVFAPTEVVTAPLPAVPVLGALPPPGQPGLGWVVLLPVLVGALTGLWLHHRSAQERWWQAAVSGAVAAGLTALVAAVLVAAAAGAVGPGRMAEVGASPPAVAGALAWQTGSGAVVVLLALHPEIHALIADGYRAAHRRLRGDDGATSAASGDDDEVAPERTAGD